MRLSILAATMALLLQTNASAEKTNRWELRSTNRICWIPTRGDVHEDQIEMSGKRISVVLRYGVNADGSGYCKKSLVWPMLRTVPNNTHASLMRRLEWDAINLIEVPSWNLRGEHVDSITIDGALHIYSHYTNGLRTVRSYTPSTDKPALMERLTVENIKKEGVLAVELGSAHTTWNTPKEKGVNGSYTIVATSDAPWQGELKPGESHTTYAYIQAFATGKGEKEITLNGEAEWQARRAFIDETQQNLVLETPEAMIDGMFAFSKIRASESIYETAGGPMHGPGGESYYAAIWANDQAEYVNPFFPFLGYAYGNASALCSYKHFARFMNNDMKPIPSSIIAEGTDIWNGVGDRGDAAMIAYGASRYVLTRGDRTEAEQLWPLIEWCLRYCNGKLTADGVVASDCDELEHRFPAGKANLCTSSLYYDALISASYLSKLLGKAGSANYAKQAAALRKAIERHFGHDMEGFHTYQYYEGNDLLRAWICIPLTMGIMDRAQGTIQALLSPHLMSPQGLLTQAKDKTYWDRATLYALRGIYAAGEANTATDFLRNYSATRLLGEHVPYAVEAWPEGNGRHLSAESGLYARIFIEGLFGIRPTGFDSFQLTPQMPDAWNKMSLRHIRAFNNDFDIEVNRVAADKFTATITTKTGKEIIKTFKAGQTLNITKL